MQRNLNIRHIRTSDALVISEIIPASRLLHDRHLQKRDSLNCIQYTGIGSQQQLSQSIIPAIDSLPVIVSEKFQDLWMRKPMENCQPS